MVLTKSDFRRYLDSPLHLWAHKYKRTEKKPSTEHSLYLSKQGYEIEKLAKEFITQKVEREYPNADLYLEHSFVDGSFYGRIDALVHDNIYDTYDMYEIKSSTGIDKAHEYDATFQYLIGNRKCNVNKLYIVHINNHFLMNGVLNLNDFFVVEDMSEVIAHRHDEVLIERERAFEIIKNSEPPLDHHCFNPKTCIATSLCHPHLSNYPIYNLANGRKPLYRKLLEQGISDCSQIPPFLKLSKPQMLQLESLKQNQPIIDHENIKAELDTLTHPLYFLDYESLNPAIPLYSNYKPYQHIVFQYSIHVVESPGAEPKHFEYLVTDTDEPSEELVKRLVSVIGDTGSVIVWNKTFEKARNKELAELQPHYAERLMSINERVYDLMDIFRKGYYVDYRFNGSCSIKEVLPVLVPEMSYKELDIGEGTAAMMAWFKITHDTYSAFDSESIHLKDKIKKDLLEYCKQDTLAMVMIWEFLIKLIS